MTRLAKTQEAQQGVAFFEFGRSYVVQIDQFNGPLETDVVGPDTDFVRIATSLNEGSVWFSIGENPTADNRQPGYEDNGSNSHLLPANSTTPPIPVRAGIDKISLNARYGGSTVSITELI